MILIQFIHSLFNKTTRTKRCNSKNKFIYSKNKIFKEIKLLHEQFILNFDWKLNRKYIFAIRKKDLAICLNIFINSTYNMHFSDTFFDIIMYKIQILNVNLQKTPKKVQNNSQLIIIFLNQVFNEINIKKIYQ